MITLPERNLRAMDALFRAYEHVRSLLLSREDRDGSIMRLHTRINHCVNGTCRALDEAGGRA